MIWSNIFFSSPLEPFENSGCCQSLGRKKNDLSLNCSWLFGIGKIYFHGNLKAVCAAAFNKQVCPPLQWYWFVGAIGFKSVITDNTFNHQVRHSQG